MTIHQSNCSTVECEHENIHRMGLKIMFGVQVFIILKPHTSVDSMAFEMDKSTEKRRKNNINFSWKMRARKRERDIESDVKMSCNIEFDQQINRLATKCSGNKKSLEQHCNEEQIWLTSATAQWR